MGTGLMQEEGKRASTENTFQDQLLSASPDERINMIYACQPFSLQLWGWEEGSYPLVGEDINQECQTCCPRTVRTYLCLFCVILKDDVIYKLHTLMLV